MQKFVCAIGLFALVLIVQELLVPVEASRVRVVKVKKTRHDKRQAQPTGYDYQDDRYNDDLGASGPSGQRPQDQYAVANRRSGRTLDDDDNRLSEFNKKVKRADDLKDDDGHCDGPCGDGIPGTAGNDYPTFASPPKTNFDCKAQKFPGYYADPEAKCQSFWICQPKRADVFLCPNGTIFNQQVMVCDWWFNVDCATSADFYSRNQYLYAGPGIDITGAQIPVYKGDKNAATAPRETRATAQSKLQRPEQSVGATGSGGNNYNRRAAEPRDNYEEIEHDESINYALTTNDRRPQRQQYIQKNYNKRDQLEYSQPQTQSTGSNTRQTTTLRQTVDDYTTQPSVGGYSTGGSTGSTGGYQTDRSVTSPAAISSKSSKTSQPFTYSPQSQNQRQTTQAAVTPRRENSGQSQRATPIQSPNSIPYQTAEYNKQQRVIYVEKPTQNQEQYFRGQQQQQRPQRYNYDSEQTTRPQTTTKRNAIDSDFSKEYSDTEDGFNFHFAKIPIQTQTPTELPAAVADKYDLGVAVTTYRPSADIAITSSPKILTDPSDDTPIRIQHPKYDEDEETYTTAAPVFGKKVKSGRKRNTADWTSYFRSKN